MRRFVLPILLFLAVAALGITTWQRSATGEPAETLTLQIGANAIYVADQAPTRRLAIALATPTSPSFVVVSRYEEGRTARQLGVSELLPAGTHENLEIPLRDKPAHESTLIAQMYTDNGDGVFDNDDIQANGKETVYTVFTIRKGARLPEIHVQ